jgi:hypothetical protein
MKPLPSTPARAIARGQSTSPTATVRSPRFRLFLLLLPLGLAACRDDKTATYRIPKEPDVPAHAPEPAARVTSAPMADPGGLAVAPADAGVLTWTAPAAWKTKPGSAMRKGSYTIGAEGGPTADLAITAFPGDVGGDLANVNRWRGQLALPPITATELPAALTTLSVNGLTLRVADLAGGTSEAPLRMLGVIVPHGSATWFFKLTGPDALVAKEKPAFMEFLQTVKVAPAHLPAPPAETPAPPTDMSGPPVVAASGPGLKWSAPARWQEQPVGGMRKATYTIPGDNGATAELAVTAFPGDVGGELANLNRWRGQLSLPPVAEAELAGTVTRLTVNGLPVTLADLEGTGVDGPQRMLGVMVPHGGATWFFKLTGPAALVAGEKPAFLAFVQTLSAP